MDVEEIRKLIRLMDEAGLTELEIEDRSGKVRLVRGVAPRRPRRDGAVEPSADGDAPEPSDLDEEFAIAAGAGAGLAAGTALAAGSSVVTSPMVGTFYRASGPDAEPFVAEGDVVHVGQVLCIIEAMKMMNEIQAEIAGRVVSVTAENGSPVEYGSPLFVLAPLD